jgi:hypothetical protein
MQYLVSTIVCIFALLSSAYAQHNHHGPDSNRFTPRDRVNPAPPPRFEQFRQYFGPALEPLPTVEEHRFSWWGYRHKDLHGGGVIHELLEKARPTNCCNGVHSGECRVSRFVRRGNALFVIVDDLECPISATTKIVTLENFSELVVCAGRTSTILHGQPRKCPNTYCIGVPPGT